MTTCDCRKCREARGNQVVTLNADGLSGTIRTVEDAHAADFRSRVIQYCSSISHESFLELVLEIDAERTRREQGQ